MKYIGSRCVDTHLSWLVYLSSVQASLTANSYPTHYGCLSILLPILLDDSAEADNLVPSHKAEYNGWFLTDVLLFTHLVHLPAAYASKTVL